jgi:NAD-dependent dihydropyrimidine dehydrogenase PreA subunit
MATSTECKHEAGYLVPQINQNKCEGAGDCLEVCPYNVFEMRKLTKEEKNQLPLPTRIKLFVHGGKQAFAIRRQDCHACGLCVQACPEKAIKLVKYSV